MSEGGRGREEGKHRRVSGEEPAAAWVCFDMLSSPRLQYTSVYLIVVVVVIVVSVVVVEAHLLLHRLTGV